MKKLIYFSFFYVLAVVLLACRDDNSELGHSLVETSFRNVFVDTCSVDISTILLDSMLTKGDSICQVGYRADTVWGKVASTYYAEYSTVNFTPDETHTYAFDSLVLRLRYSGHYWGDTLAAQRISVYQLKRPIVLDNDQDLYNYTSWPKEDTPFFTFEFKPRPGRGKEQTIRFPDAMGRMLLEGLVEENDAFDSQEDFKNYFHGLAFVPDEGGSCITGLQVNDSAMVLTLYYSDISTERVQKELAFKVNVDYAYTGIVYDRNGTPLADITSGIENLVHSYNTGNRAYQQGLTGFYNQLEFPYLNTLEEAGDIVSVENAMLYLYPVRGSYGKQNQLPDELRLYITDENNVLEDYVYGSDGVTVQTGNLTTDDMFGKDTYYSFDLTTFVRNNLGTWGTARQKLLLSMSDEDMATSFDQVVFANHPSQERQCRLDVRIRVYNTD